jgi:hypothetical protein
LNSDACVRLEKRIVEDESVSEMPSESELPREVFEERRVLGLLFNDSFAVAEIMSKKGEDSVAASLVWIDYISLYDSFLKKMPTEGPTGSPVCLAYSQ